MVLIGLVLGWTWLAAYRRSPAEGARYLAGLAILGAAMLLAFFLSDWWLATPVHFGLHRDFILNDHWIPRGVALLWVLGMVLLLLAVVYWVLEVRQWLLPWLVLLGQTALFLYFVHQILALPIVNEHLGWRFNAWPQFWLANIAFIIVLIGLGWAWRESKLRRNGIVQKLRAMRQASGAGRSDFPIR